MNSTIKSLTFLFLLLFSFTYVSAISISTPSTLNDSTDHLELVILPLNTSISIDCHTINDYDDYTMIELISPKNIITTINVEQYTTTDYDLHEAGKYYIKCMINNNKTEVISSSFKVKLIDDIKITEKKNYTKWVVLIIIGMLALLFVIGIIYQTLK